MLWYLILFAVLFVLALVEGSSRARWAGYAAGALLALVAGLRYETGFDWADYENHYLFTIPFGQGDIYASVTTIMVEPGFELLVRILRTVGADFQVLLFICGAFSMFALTRMTARFSPLIGVVLLWYYGFLFLPGPMATMRQTFSVAFIYLAFVAANDRRTVRAAILCAIALSLHYFSAAFIPIVFYRWRSPTLKVTAITAAIGFALAIAGNNVLASLTNVIMLVTGGGFVADKMSNYNSFVAASISPLSVALVFWHLGFVWLVERKRPDREYIVTCALVATWLSVLAHSLLAPFPIVWDRLMLVTFPLQAIALCRFYVAELRLSQFRTPMIGVAALGSLMALTYILLDPQSIVYKPYQNVAVAWVRGPYGNGRLRYQIVRNDTNQLFAEQKIK